jgi:hypothetical protein
MGAKIEITEDLVAKVKELFDQDLGARAIAKQLGIGRWIVQKIYKVLGIYNIGRTKPRHVYKMTEKICVSCQETKGVDQFRQRFGKYTDGTDRVSYESSCLDCEKAYTKRNSNRRYKDRIKIPRNKIRRSISFAIYRAMISQGVSKNGDSCLPYLDYTIDQLVTHIESQFEAWMNWGNYGRYNKGDQPNTKWNIDHVIPQSDLPYDSMEHPNFKRCWALSNLRPLCAKQNVLDGTRKTRHQINNNDMVADFP